MSSSFDVTQVRSDFPLLQKGRGGRPWVYLDSAATAQKPQSVIQAEVEYYESLCANVHRGVYYLSEKATEVYEGVRPKVARFIGAPSTDEVIFTRGTTESVNLVASTWGRTHIHAGDVIAVTRMEHHAVFVPWQQLAQERGARFEIIELTEDYRLDPVSLERVLALKPKVLALTMMSNVLGTINPIRTIAQAAHDVGALVLVDAAQSIAHGQLKLSELGPIDFLAFSAHKVFGPTGVGVLWGRRELLEEMPPYQFGGDMIERVTDQSTRFAPVPMKFEAGTPNIAGVIGFGAALDYLGKLDLEAALEHEHRLARRAMGGLLAIPSLKLYGPQDLENRGAVMSFSLPGVHAHDLATFLDQDGIAVRAGHHCAHPLMIRLGVASATRASFAFYNTESEVDALLESLDRSMKYFKRGAHVGRS